MAVRGEEGEKAEQHDAPQRARSIDDFLVATDIIRL